MWDTNCNCVTVNKVNSNVTVRRWRKVHRQQKAFDMRFTFMNLRLVMG